MPDGQQVTWDEPQAQAPQVRWDDEQKSAETPSRPFGTRFKEFLGNVFSPSDEKLLNKTVEKPVNDVPTSPFTIPGGETPLAEGLKRAGVIAQAGAGIGDSAMGMPSSNVAGLAGEIASIGGEGAKAIGRGVSGAVKGAGDLAARAAREPGKYTTQIAPVQGQPGKFTRVIGPPTRGALKPWAKVGVGPLANIGSIMDTLIPAREPEVAAQPPVVKPMPAAKPAPAGIPTSAFRGQGITVPPPSGGGEMTSTGAMPAEPLGTPPAAKAAAIKQGIETATEPQKTGSEGRPATWTNEVVRQQAAKGNRDAIAQAIRRGMELPENARYVMGSPDLPRAVLNPREVTRFTPEGTPIRNVDNPIAQNPSSGARIARAEMPAARVEPELTKATRINEAAVKNRPEWTAQQYDAEITRAKGILRNPEATPEDQLHAQRVIESTRELQAATQPKSPNFKVTPPPETSETPAVRVPRPKPVPASRQYAPDIIEQAENEMRGALELSDTMPQAGRHFAENTFEEHPLAGRYNVKAGERPGGTWSGISSQKGNISGQYPWFNDPDISPAKLRNAIQQGKGAAYERIVGKIAERITRERAEATATISDQIPQLRELAAQIQELEPDLAQALNDLADGKLALAPEQLKAYVTEKITDATAAAQFSREIDDAAEAAREASASEVNESPNPAREGSGETGPAAQAPELKSPEGILPGMENAVAQQRIAAGVEQGRQLTEKLNAPPRSIEAAAGEMERMSPLFRGTEASPQKELLPPRQSMMGEAIALSSPSGKMSQRALLAAQERIRQGLFGKEGLPGTEVPQPTEVESLLRQAATLRGLASRGMKPRAYLAEAERLEARARELQQR